MLDKKGHRLDILETGYAWEFSELKRFVPGNIWSFLSRASLFQDLKVDKKTSSLLMLYEIELVIVSCAILSLLAIPVALEYLGVSLNFQFRAISYSIVALGAGLWISGNGLLKRKRFSSIFPDFDLIENAFLLFIYTAAFFSFGAGTFFASSSVFPLNPHEFLKYVGFFSFALLTGYLSIITPSGLGVREAVITFGLSKSLPIGNAGLIAIFSRIILMASEVIFAALIFVAARLFAQNTRRFLSLLLKYKHEVILFLLSVSYTLYFTLATFLKHDSFYTGRFDLGNMDQTVWNTIHGRIFQLTDPNGTETVSRLAFHSDFILIFLSPLYLLWESPKMLLFTQSIILALGGIFVYAIAWKILKNKLVALVFAFAFFINPAVNYTNLFDFHAVSLATTFFLGAFYFMLNKKYLPMTLFLILAGITKEQILVITALFGAYIFLFNKRRMLGASIFTISFLIFYILIWHAIPNASGSQHFALQFYSDYGESPTDVIKNIFLDPVSTIKTLFQKDQLDYVRKIFIPTGYLSIFSPLALLFALPDLAINLLSQNKQMHEIYYQYSAAITPFVFVSTIFGFKNIKSAFPFLSYSSLATLVFVLSLISAYSYGPLPLAKKPQTVMFTEPLGNREVIEETLSGIPKEKSVSASNNLGAHLSQREKIYVIPNGVDVADVVVILAKTDEKSLEILRQVSQDPYYILVFRDRDFYVYKKLGNL